MIWNSFISQFLSYGPVIYLLDIYPGEIFRQKSQKKKKKFKEALFVIVQNWEELKCPSAGKEINTSTSI